jgi:cob(I)alamin adenosyltransferase
MSFKDKYETHGLGFTQVFWGNGKGKTTSALGTALRACGNDYKVHLIQFMKNGADTLEEQIPGEIKALSKHPTFSYKRFGSDGWVIKTPKPSQIKSCQEALQYVSNSLQSDKYNIVIADEILYAVQLELLKEQEIIDLIKNKPKDKELILTGSHKPFLKIHELADLVTEIKKEKHPFDKGFIARKGLEY